MEKCVKACLSLRNWPMNILHKKVDSTDEELDFIINYDIKYRMGESNEEEEED